LNGGNHSYGKLKSMRSIRCDYNQGGDAMKVHIVTNGGKLIGTVEKAEQYKAQSARTDLVDEIRRLVKRGRKTEKREKR